MDRISCRFERLSNFSIGLVLMAFGFTFVGLGVTILPLFGFVIAIAAFGAAIMFMKAKKSTECSIGE